MRRFQRKGPRKTTRILLEALRAQGVSGATLLDIGGGIGAIQHELLDDGVTEATSVDASSAYLGAARAEAEKRGYAGRVRYFHGNFVELAKGIPPADIVTLDRVICCYDEMEALVRSSAARASRLYGVVFPRSAWWVRLATALANVTLWIRGSPFRIFAHPTAAVEGVVAAQRMRRVFRRSAGMWQVAVYAR
jgi:2-polyprenyl-3-methyl-5-hydroxy-6-metoxy-1,4-benzoquinol methylase